MAKTKAAAEEAASQNSSPATQEKKEKQEVSPEKNPKEKASIKGGGGKTEKKVKYTNPFSHTDPLQKKFINSLMKKGKKTVAQNILREAFDELARLGENEPRKTFEAALQNASPSMNVQPKRIGGAIYQIPVEVPSKRQQSLAIRWILQGARGRKGRPMHKRLAQELMDAANETGHAVTKKNDAHRMAQSNKAFAHLARY
ncbi:30S ribosomal protein S7 [Candidatus Gracilibacteria bacterium]|nr:30S ribosomal protein S7 [Candidatus Gracilibacteria bacterium]MCF7819182.1 30S ribosomal protein S7 [Candidatus Gracilibacteria bacterium]